MIAILFVCAMSGSGKSSMMNAIFRIEELVGGRITIDGLDIAAVPLTTLRSTLGIIPVITYKPSRALVIHTQWCDTDSIVILIIQ